MSSTKLKRSDLSEQDQAFLGDILTKVPADLSVEEAAHLRARRDYLTPAEIEEYADALVEPVAEKKVEEKKNYSKMKLPELIAELESRELDAPVNPNGGDPTKAMIIEVLEASDAEIAAGE